MQTQPENGHKMVDTIYNALGGKEALEELDSVFECQTLVSPADEPMGVLIRLTAEDGRYAVRIMPNKILSWKEGEIYTGEFDVNLGFYAPEPRGFRPAMRIHDIGLKFLRSIVMPLLEPEEPLKSQA